MVSCCPWSIFPVLRLWRGFQILQATLDDTNRQLAQTLDQYAIVQRKLSAALAELEECKTAMDNAIRARKQVDRQAGKTRRMERLTLAAISCDPCSMTGG